MTTVDRPTSQGWVADDSTFGARLALIRQRMRWGNVKEAATACGLPTESWRSWERDGRVPQRLVEIAAIIADRTGCDRGWLIDPTLKSRGVAGGADTLHNRHMTERRSQLVTGHAPRSSDRSHKPDTGRNDPRRPRILPRTGVGTA